MTVDEAIEIINRRYGFLKGYVTTEGRMLHVIAAESELRAIPGVKFPEHGIAIFGPEAIELARGEISIEGLVRRKHPELFPKGKTSRDN